MDDHLAANPVRRNSSDRKTDAFAGVVPKLLIGVLRI